MVRGCLEGVKGVCICGVYTCIIGVHCRERADSPVDVHGVYGVYMVFLEVCQVYMVVYTCYNGCT